MKRLLLCMLFFSTMAVFSQNNKEYYTKVYQSDGRARMKKIDPLYVGLGASITAGLTGPRINVSAGGGASIFLRKKNFVFELNVGASYYLYRDKFNASTDKLIKKVSAAQKDEAAKTYQQAYFATPEGAFLTLDAKFGFYYRVKVKKIFMYLGGTFNFTTVAFIPKKLQTKFKKDFPDLPPKAYLGVGFTWLNGFPVGRNKNMEVTLGVDAKLGSLLKPVKIKVNDAKFETTIGFYYTANVVIGFLGWIF